MRAIILFSLLFLSARISAQEIPKANFNDSILQLDNEIFVGDPATQAEYPGGYVAMMKFIKENLVIPKLFNNDTINGKVLLRFMVTKTGDLSNFSVAKGIDNCKECSQEALNLLEKFPKWNPAEIMIIKKKNGVKSINGLRYQCYSKMIRLKNEITSTNRISFYWIQFHCPTITKK